MNTWENIKIVIPNSLRDRKVTYRVKKPETPIIFVDSNFMISFGRCKGDSQVPLSKTRKLYNLFYRLSINGTYYFPFSDYQVMEFVRNTKHSKDIMKTVLTSINNCTKLKDYLEIEDYYESLGFTSFRKNKEDNIDYNMLFKNSKLALQDKFNYRLFSQELQDKLNDEQMHIAITIYKFRKDKLLAQSLKERIRHNQQSKSNEFSRALYKAVYGENHKPHLLLSNYEKTILDNARSNF